MKRLILISFSLFALVNMSNAQSIDEFNAMKAEKAAEVAELEGQIGALKGELDEIQKELDILSGWVSGYGGMIGFDFNSSNNWISNPNPDATSTALNANLSGFINKVTEKTFWNNKGIVTKAWQDIDLSSGDQSNDDDNLFDNGTIDILNLSSLAGYKIHPKFALSSLGELNSSVENFLDPGTLDIGAGGTLLPIENMTVVVHPLNYHLAFSGVDGVESAGALGAKLRADYTRDFSVSGKKVSWSSTFTTFFPYSSDKQVIPLPDGSNYEADLFEYTWLNSFAFEVWNGIGVGLGFGLRSADFESTDTQSYTSIGLAYGF